LSFLPDCAKGQRTIRSVGLPVVSFLNLFSVPGKQENHLLLLLLRRQIAVCAAATADVSGSQSRLPVGAYNHNVAGGAAANWTAGSRANGPCKVDAARVDQRDGTLRMNVLHIECSIDLLNHTMVGHYFDSLEGN